MAKKKKFPKEPKSTASKETLLAHKKKCEEIQKFNAGIDKELNDKKKIREDVKKIKAK